MLETSNPQPSAPPFVRLAKYLFVAALLLELLLPALFHRTALVRSPGFAWVFCGIATGLGLGILLTYFWRKYGLPRGWRAALVLLGLPISAAIMGWYAAILLFEWTSFSGTRVQSEIVVANVIGLGNGRRSASPSAEIRLGEEGRSVFVKIDEDFYRRLEPYRKPGRDCLRLTVQTGRNGVQRFILPAEIGDVPFSVKHWVDCKDPANSTLPKPRS